VNWEGGDSAPPGLQPFIKSASRPRDGIASIVFSHPPPSSIVEEIAKTTRIAFGAQEIWNMFPEYRPDFTVKIWRSGSSDKYLTEIPLADVIVGDEISSPELSLYDNPWHPSNNYIAKDVIKVTDIDFSQYEFLSKKSIIGRFSLKQKTIFLLRRFSISDILNSRLNSEIRFISYSDLFDKTDFLELLDDKNSPFKNGQGVLSRLSPDISGALILDGIDNFYNGYYDAVSNRIFAAAAIATQISAQLHSKIEFRENGMAYAFGMDRDYGRPYLGQGRPIQTISAEHPVFHSIVALLKLSDKEKFYQGKEDFRLQAIDTIDDSRRPGIPLLQFAQMWMAIERLLSFNQETSSQLALALSALFPAGERVEKFKYLKRLYDLRSRIVHGYSFPRSNDFYMEIRELSLLFRKLLVKSVHDNIQDGRTLRDLLVGHVLGANAEPAL
jgi:hypothetical protein